MSKIRQHSTDVVQVSLRYLFWRQQYLKGYRPCLLLHPPRHPKSGFPKTDTQAWFPGWRAHSAVSQNCPWCITAYLQHTLASTAGHKKSKCEQSEQPNTQVPPETPHLLHGEWHGITVAIWLAESQEAPVPLTSDPSSQIIYTLLCQLIEGRVIEHVYIKLHCVPLIPGKWPIKFGTLSVAKISGKLRVPSNMPFAPL